MSLPALFRVLVYLELTEKNEYEAPSKKKKEEEEASIQYMDEGSLNGTLVPNNRFLL